MQEPAKTLGGKITSLRIEAGLTVEDVAESVSCPSTYIEAIEDDRAEPSDDFLRRLADRLGAVGASLEHLGSFRLQDDATAQGEWIDQARERRIKLVIATFGIALGVTFCGLLFLEGRDAPFVAVLGFPLFPAYLWRWLPIVNENVGPVVLPLIGWIVYLGLGLVVVKGRNRQARSVSFALFLLLLCGNVVSCWYEVNAPHYE